MKTPIAETLEFYSIPEPNSGCLLWIGGYDRKGYGQILAGAGRSRRAHRIAFEEATGTKVPRGLLVCHKCDVSACINPDHLFLGTNDENMADMVAKGRQQRGTRHALAKLTPEKVRAIRADSRPSRAVAADHGVTAANVRSVKTGRCWSWVQ